MRQRGDTLRGDVSPGQLRYLAKQLDSRSSGRKPPRQDLRYWRCINVDIDIRISATQE
jgi:hypothetical protein